VNRKKRVLHVIKTFSLGGAETNLLNLVQAMDPARVETHVAYSFGGEIEERFKSEGVRLFKYAEGSHKIKSLATPFIVLKLAAYILRHRIDVVHTHLFNAHVWGGAAARLTGRKVVEHVHDFRYIDETEREKGGYHVDQFRFIRQTKNLSDAVVVLTAHNKEFLLEEGLQPLEKIWLIRNGIAPAAVPGENGGGIAGRKIFLVTARIAAEKNIDLLFRVAPEVAKVCPEALFVVAGDGPLLEEYRLRAETEGLGNFLQFIGYRADVKELLKTAYALVLPSFLELHPISILEALNAGVPVVVSRGVGCNSEVFTQGENAFLLDPHEPAEWTQTLIALARDPERRRRIGEEGYRLCRKEFNIHRVAERIEGLYETLLQTR